MLFKSPHIGNCAIEENEDGIVDGIAVEESLTARQAEALYKRAGKEPSLAVKEALAFAVSLTSRSPFGTAFHLTEMRRLGISERGVTEVLGVTQMFSSYTKIADTLQLEPDMGGIAPVDDSPAPR